MKTEHKSATLNSKTDSHIWEKGNLVWLGNQHLQSNYFIKSFWWCFMIYQCVQLHCTYPLPPLPPPQLQKTLQTWKLQPCPTGGKTQALLRLAVWRDQDIVNMPALPINSYCDPTGWLPCGLISYTFVSWLKSLLRHNTKTCLQGWRSI